MLDHGSRGSFSCVDCASFGRLFLVYLCTSSNLSAKVEVASLILGKELGFYLKTRPDSSDWRLQLFTTPARQSSLRSLVILNTPYLGLAAFN